jgi:molybdopterin molybdotransferase
MISVSNAKEIVKANSKPLPPKLLSLNKAYGLVLAEDVLAPIDIPPFQQAAMDGYAFAFADLEKVKTLKISGEIPAGHNKRVSHTAGQATRIFTGAPVPEGADTVVMQEKVSVGNDELHINDTELQQGINVRPKGSEVTAGTIALSKDTVLSPGAIGYLAALGIAEVLVYPKPAIAVIVTGNELQQPGNGLQTGQVYESNSFTIHAALQQLHLTDVHLFFASDNLLALERIINDCLLEYDMVLLTGGVSAGDYDFVVRAAKTCGVTQQFHKVAQRPGKPLYFGKRDTKLLFGLPGNPASVLTCFYQYVIPALEGMLCKKDLLPKVQVPLATAYSKKAGLTHFLKGWCDGKQATPLPAQESYKLSSFAIANCLITLEEGATQYQQGDLIDVHLLPF